MKLYKKFFSCGKNIKNTLLLMFFLVSPVFSQSVIFHDDFLEPTLDSDWIVLAGSGFGSGGDFSIISEAPSFLQYTLTNDGKTLPENSLWIYRQFSGDNWRLDMKVHYSMLSFGQGRQLSFRIFFDDVNEIPVSGGNHIHWFRDRDSNRNKVSLLSNVNSTQGGTRFNFSLFNNDTYIIRIIRQGNTVTIKAHDLNSTEFTTMAQYVFLSETLEKKQFVLISGSSHAGESPSNVAQYDYISVIDNTDSCTISKTLPDNQWMLIGVACLPSDATVQAVFADDMIGTYDEDWVLYRRDATSDSYVKMNLTDSVSQSESYWVISLSGAEIDVTGSETPVVYSPECPSANGCFEVPLVSPLSGSTLWHLVGQPFASTINWSDVDVVSDSTIFTSPTDAESNNIVDHSVFRYNGSNYDAIIDSTPSPLLPMDGYWLSVLSGAASHNVKLLIPKP